MSFSTAGMLMAEAEGLQNPLSGFESQSRLHMTTIELNTSTDRRSFMTPVGDYYTVAPISLGMALELADLHVKRVVVREIPDEAVQQLFFEAGVQISVLPEEENRLTGS